MGIGRDASLQPYSLAITSAMVILFAKALQTMPVSVGYPILAGVGFAALAISAAVLFGEALTPGKIGGMTLILLGIVLLARSA